MLHRELLYPYTLLYFTVAYVDSQVQELSIPTAREWIAASMLSVTGNSDCVRPALNCTAVIRVHVGY